MAGKEIRFYHANAPYGQFSNFSRHAVIALGRKWPTSEHFFQAMKFIETDPQHFERIAAAATPREAAEMGRDRGHRLRDDWEDVKDDVMRLAVLLKFSWNPKLRELLEATGTATLIEDAPSDSYWGIGTDGTGKNMLGIILMEAREAFRTFTAFTRIAELTARLGLP